MCKISPVTVSLSIGKKLKDIFTKFSRKVKIFSRKMYFKIVVAYVVVAITNNIKTTIEMVEFIIISLTLRFQFPVFCSQKQQGGITVIILIKVSEALFCK